MLAINAQTAWQRDSAHKRVPADEARFAQRKGNADRHPLSGNRRVVDPVTRRRVALTQADRRFKNALIQQRVPCITLPATAALDTGTTGIAVFAKVVAASAGGIGEVRPREMISGSASSGDAACADFSIKERIGTFVMPIRPCCGFKSFQLTARRIRDIQRIIE